MRLQLSIPPETGQLRSVRRVLDGWSAAHDVPSDSLNLIATELLANAMAVCPPDQRIELVLELRNEEVSLSVTDCGPDGLDGFDIGPVDASSVRGRGLHIVRSLSNRLAIERVDGKTVVTAYQYRRMLGLVRSDEAHHEVPNRRTTSRP